VLDLRPLVTCDLSVYGYRSQAVTQPGDPAGSSILDLGPRSRFHNLDARRLRGVFTDRRATVRSHSGGRHAYSISNSILNADVFVSVPKLKTHHKVGATLNVKGLVGINSDKNLLPHWRNGYAEQGGDEYPIAHRRLDRARLALAHALSDWLPERVHLAGARLLPRRVQRLLERRTVCSHERYRGAWDGNDTCWRMAADLYAVFVQDRTGWRAAHARSPLRFLSIIDGVTAGEGDGPFHPEPVEAGVLIGGEDLLLVDALAVRYMDFDLREVRYLASLLAEAGIDLAQVPVLAERSEVSRCFRSTEPLGRFRAPDGWPRLSLHQTEDRAA
jgi:hypothetical protein